ncbi:MAG: hypothetical protein JM58_09180 [Peptococcaceae bacterium BICA1-8]|nr:MAG: hypothetical protein JM58_09180 [Peptococcaceae bacterium BICA1-8]
MPERNCNKCKFGMFQECETLKNNKEYQNIPEGGISDTGRWGFKRNFICDKYKSIYIEYPIEVSKINHDTNKGGYRDREIGKFVSIRPCGKEYQDKTYLGLYLGDLPIGHHISHNPDTKELNVSFHDNPAIFVFDLNKIVYGCESWWGIIKNEADLRKITDIDIDNVWYVKALKVMFS